MDVLIFVLLEMAAVFAIVRAIRTRSTFSWGYGAKALTVAVPLAVLIGILALMAPLPNNWLGLVWLLPAIFVAVMIVSMSIVWDTDSNVGCLLDRLTWGFPAIADDDPRRIPGNPEYDSKYDSKHSDYDVNLDEANTRYAIRGLFIAQALLLILMFSAWVLVGLANMAKIPNAAVPAETTTTAPSAGPTTPGTPVPNTTSTPTGGAPSFGCTTPVLRPYTRGLARFGPAGVDSCVNGNWEKWDRSYTEIQPAFHEADANYRYYTFTEKGKEYLIRIRIVPK